MKKSMSKILFGLLVVAMFIVSPNPAEAINVKLKNPYPHTLNVAIVYYEDAARNWVAKGWFNVKPRSTRTLRFDDSTKKETIYIHAHNREASWGGGNKGSITRTVINEAFKFYDGERCPAGNNRRKISFDRWYTENDGVVYWRP